MAILGHDEAFVVKFSSADHACLCSPSAQPLTIHCADSTVSYSTTQAGAHDNTENFCVDAESTPTARGAIEMCYFILLHAICRHHAPILMAGPYCQALKQQLTAIDRASAAYYCAPSPGGIPFQLDPMTCEPNANNTCRVSMWCGWECRNSYDATSSLEGQFLPGPRRREESGQARGLGEPGAEFGVPRSGVGWQDQQGMDWRDIEGNGWGEEAGSLG